MPLPVLRIATIDRTVLEAQLNLSQLPRFRHFALTEVGKAQSKACSPASLRCQETGN